MYSERAAASRFPNFPLIPCHTLSPVGHIDRRPPRALALSLPPSSGLRAHPSELAALPRLRASSPLVARRLVLSRRFSGYSRAAADQPGQLALIAARAFCGRAFECRAAPSLQRYSRGNTAAGRVLSRSPVSCTYTTSRRRARYRSPSPLDFLSSRR